MESFTCLNQTAAADFSSAIGSAAIPEDSSNSRQTEFKKQIMKYLIQIEDGEFGETRLDAWDIEQAEDLARRWVLEGDWGRRGREEFVGFTIKDENEVEWVFRPTRQRPCGTGLRRWP